MFDLIKRHKLIFLFFVIIFLFFLNSYSNAYTQVEYIYGDGSQYIDTGIAENNVFGLDFGFRAGSVYANWQCLLGGNVWYQSTEDFGLMNVRYSANSVCCRVRGTQIFGGSSVSTSEMNVFKILNNKWYVNDTSGDVSTSSALGRLSDHIFILNGHTKQRNSRGYIYYLKLYDNNGNLLRDMIPVIDNNNVVCMYDKISQSYFYNGGTGNFTAGPVVVPAIESFFHLEYENSNDFPIVYSKWYDYIDSSKEQDDIYRETIFANQHYYGVKDNEHAYVLFLKNSRDVQGWKSFEGDENENGPGYEDNYETSNDINDLKWRVGYQITDYGEYYFCHYDVEHDTYSIERFIINHNEVVSDYYDVDTGEYTRLETYNETEVSTIIDNVGAYDNLSLRVEQNENVGSIFTNWLNWNNGYNYELYWSKDSINWDSIYSYEENESNKRRYILDVLENGTYYIKLRIFDSNNLYHD